MNINLIRNGECHIWKTTEKVLKEVLKESDLPQDYKVIVVKNNEGAQKYRFFGSPQITVDDRDIDPSAEKATQFQVSGCRFYVWEGKMYEYPPAGMILRALKQVV